MNIKILRNFKTTLMKGLLVLIFGISFSNLFAQNSYYWKGYGSSDNISDFGNWFVGSSNPSSGDNLYFNNTGNDCANTGRKNAYSDYGIGSYFNNIIFYACSGGIKFYGNNTYALKFENFSESNLCEFNNSEIGNRPGYDVEVNPTGSGGLLLSGSTFSIDCNSNANRQIKVYGANTLTINNAIYEKNTSSGTYNGSLQIMSGATATVVLSGANTFTGTTIINGGVLRLNRSGGTTIPITNNVTVSGGTFRVSTDQTLNNLTISSGGLIIDNGVTLTINGTLNYTSSTANTFNGNLVIGSTGVLSVSSNTFATNGKLTLKSNATGTASIGSIGSGGSISGEVTVERYIASAGRRWRFLSSPVQSKTIADWRSQFAITGPGTTSNLVVGDLNNSGWHQTYNNINYSTPATTTSVRRYVEANSTSVNLNLGWTDVTTGTALTAGQGFRAFIRGPISGVTTQLGVNGNSTTQAAVTLSLTGAINSGNITPPAASLTYNGAGRGWNLLGNPYPCAYNFNAHYDAANVAEIANVNPTVYVYNSTGGTPAYVSYNASSDVSGGLTGGIIPSGSGFFIEASNTPTFVFKETYKTTSAPVSLHKTDISNVEFGIKYSKDTLQGDYMVVKMFDGATLNSELYDIKKLKNDDLNLSAYGEDTIQLTASCIPFITEETRIKLNVEATEIGTYKFEFTNLENFDPSVSVHLFDRFTNITTDVKANTLYNFEMGPGENQWGKNRFELILNKSNTGVENVINSIAYTNLTVYPNPATDILNINLSNANFKNSNIVIYNVSGMEVSKSIMNGASAQLNIESLSNGVYFVKVSNENGFSKTVKFVK